LIALVPLGLFQQKGLGRAMGLNGQRVYLIRNMAIQGSIDQAMARNPI
jgi:hypothetical protein